MVGEERQNATTLDSPPRFLWRRPFRWRIAPTLALIFTGTVTIATVINGIVVTTSSLGVAQQTTAQRLREATRALAAELDADDLATLGEPSQQSDPIYLRSHARLARALDQIEGVRFIYTLRKVQGTPKDAFSRYAFVVDGTPYGSKDFEPIGAVMTTSPSTDALHRVWTSGRFEVDRNFVTDRGGTWLSGYYPLFRRDGSFEAVLSPHSEHGEQGVIAARPIRAGEELLIEPASDADDLRKLSHLLAPNPGVLRR